MKAVLIVGQMAAAHAVNALGVLHDADRHIFVQAVSPVLKGSAYTLPLPAVPVCHEAEVPVLRRAGFSGRKHLQFAGLCQLPGSTAGSAGQLRSLSGHRSLRFAAGTAVQNAV